MKKFTFLLLPLLALTACGGGTPLDKNAVKETARDIREDFATNSSTIKQMTLDTTIKAETKTNGVKSTATISSSSAIDLENHYVRYEADLSDLTESRSITSWLYLDLATNQFVSANEAIIRSNGTESIQREYTTLTPTSDLAEFFEETIDTLELEAPEREDAINEELLQIVENSYEYLESVKIQYPGCEAQLSVKSNGEGHVRFNFELKVKDYVTSQGTGNLNETTTIEYDDYRFASFKDETSTVAVTSAGTVESKTNTNLKMNYSCTNSKPNLDLFTKI